MKNSLYRSLLVILIVLLAGMGFLAYRVWGRGSLNAYLPFVTGSGVSTDYPILFVTQPPITADFTTIGSTFGNHLASMQSVARGGDLWIRYPDGSLKNLTAQAGYGSTNPDGFQDDNAILTATQPAPAIRPTTPAITVNRCPWPTAPSSPYIPPIPAKKMVMALTIPITLFASCHSLSPAMATGRPTSL